VELLVDLCPENWVPRERWLLDLKMKIKMICRKWFLLFVVFVIVTMQRIKMSVVYPCDSKHGE
jgi:hypothetical protein